MTSYDSLRVGRLMLAEDNQEMRSLLASTLRNDGYEVIEARTGVELLDQIQFARQGEKPVDIVVADVRMPGLTGLEVLRRLQREEFTAPVILITAFGDEETHRTALDLGAAAVLDKPFDLDDLSNVVLYFKRQH
jgi:DNA-binding response OmpR family regulator